MASQGVSKVFRKVLGPFLKLLGYSGGFRKLQGRSWDVPYGLKEFYRLSRDVPEDLRRIHVCYREFIGRSKGNRFRGVPDVFKGFLVCSRGVPFGNSGCCRSIPGRLGGFHGVSRSFRGVPGDQKGLHFLGL